MSGSRRYLMGNGGNGVFDPVDDIGWDHIYWAEGSEFAAQGYSDTDEVTTWPDEVGTDDGDSDGGAGTVATYVASSGIGSQPAVRFDSTNDIMAVAMPPTLTQPFTYVFIVKVVNTGGTFFVGDTASDGGASRHGFLAGSDWQMFASATTNTGITSNTNANLLVAYYDGASSELEQNGTSGGTLNPGTTGSVGLHLNSRYTGSQYAGMDLAFFGRYDGDVRDDADWADFEQWVEDHYGITIA